MTGSLDDVLLLINNIVTCTQFFFPCACVWVLQIGRPCCWHIRKRNDTVLQNFRHFLFQWFFSSCEIPHPNLIWHQNASVIYVPAGESRHPIILLFLSSRVVINILFCFLFLLSYILINWLALNNNNNNNRWKSMKHEGDGDTTCNWCTWNNS